MASNSVQYIFDIIDRYTPALRRIGGAQKRFNDSIKRSNKNLKFAALHLKKAGAASRRFGRDLTLRVTAPIIALGAVAATSFARMETGLINVNNLLSRDELKIFASDLERLQEQAIKAGFSIDDANRGLFDNVSALGASEKSFETFNIAQKLAIGGATTLAVAVDGITSIVSAYGKETTDATEVANAFFSAQVKGKTTVEQLAGAVGKVAPIAKTAGIGFKELLAGMSALTLGGLSTDEASTALRGVFKSLIKPTTQAAKILDHMGIVSGAVNIKAAGLSKTLLSLSQAQEKFGTDALAQAIPEMRAFTGVAALGADKIKILDEILIKMNSDVKTGDGQMRAFNDQSASMAQTFKRARGEMTIAMKQFGEVIAPALIKVAKLISKLADFLSKLSPTVKKTIVVALGLAAVLGPLLIIFGALASSIGSIITIWPLLVAGFSAVAPILGTILTSINPVLLAIVGLAIATRFLIKHWSTVKRVVADSSVFKFAAASIRRLVEAIDKFKQSYRETVDFITKSNPLAKGLGKIKGFFGGDIGTSSETNVNTDVNISVDDPRGIVQKVATKTDKSAGPSNGPSMKESLP